ncbi:FHA domain-containing protein [Natronospora cellulosivora (SeqCode)]
MLNRVLNFINLPKQIKKYILRHKIKNIKQAKNKKSEDNIIKLINVLIFTCLSIGILYISHLYNNGIFFGVISIIALLCLYLITRIFMKGSLEKKYSQITKLILKDEEGQILNEWQIENLISCLIGKKTNSNQVDIDLSNAVYSSLVSREHAVLNFTGERWYFEDIGSSNGSGIKPRGENKKFKVEEGQLYQVSSGDILYIANTKLYLK